MSTVTYVYRDFNPGDGTFVGSIELYILPNNQIELQIMGLHDNEYADMGIQSTVIIDYPIMIPLFDVMNIILNKITEDHLYKLRNVKYKDFILCSKELEITHPELVNHDTRANYDGSVWMEFNEDNIEYLGGYIQSNVGSNCIIIYGKVTEDKQFIYDFPIVSRNAVNEYYKLTRGKRVWDIDYDEKTKTYIHSDWDNEA